MSKNITVAVLVRGGVVQGVRASAPIEVVVCDVDGINVECGGGTKGPCDANESTSDQNAHQETRAAYATYTSLPIEAF